jgi:hypothetical protein
MKFGATMSLSLPFPRLGVLGEPALTKRHEWRVAREKASEFIPSANGIRLLQQDW